MIRSWLELIPADGQNISIEEPYSFETTAIRNRVWYNGKAPEIEQLQKALVKNGFVDTSFWGMVPSTEKIRKIHSGLPKILVRTLARIVKADMSDISFDKDPAAKARWDEIKDDINFKKIVGKALVTALAIGDACFKLSVDTAVSQGPLLEVWPADKCKYYWDRGKFVGVDFYTYKNYESKRYRLVEMYRIGSVSYRMEDASGKNVDLSIIPEYAGLKPVTFIGDFIMAEPLIIYESTAFVGRGEAIYDGKMDNLDALDEVISQWLDDVRAGRVQKYIPQELLPRDEKTGAFKSINRFGTDFIKIKGSMKEDAAKQIEVVQPEIRYQAYLSSYCSILDMCLQGIISPATLGIDVTKMASGEAQREKKDVTGITRNTITEVLEDVLPNVVVLLLKVYDTMQAKDPGEYACEITFGEYGAPDFDSRIESVSKASTSGIMSTEAQVDELWGDSKDKEWKAEEVARIKAEKGISEDSEPAVGDDLIVDDTAEVNDVDGEEDELMA